MAELKCAECGQPIYGSDADLLVDTDAGPVHGECFKGPVPVGAPSWFRYGSDGKKDESISVTEREVDGKRAVEINLGESIGIESNL